MAVGGLAAGGRSYLRHSTGPLSAGVAIVCGLGPEHHRRRTDGVRRVLHPWWQRCSSAARDSSLSPPAVAIFTVHLPHGFSSIKLQSFDAAGAHFGQPGYETDLLYLAAASASGLQRQDNDL